MVISRRLENWSCAVAELGLRWTRRLLGAALLGVHFTWFAREIMPAILPWCWILPCGGVRIASVAYLAWRDVP